MQPAIYTLYYNEYLTKQWLLKRQIHYDYYNVHSHASDS